MYKQIDEVAMGSPFDPALANTVYLLPIMNHSFSMKFQNLPHTFDTLITPSLFSTKKLTLKNI